MRIPKRLVSTTVLCFALPALAWAGGVVVTLDHSTTSPQAGVPLAVGFTIISMHTGEPEAGYAPEVRAVNPASGERLAVTARPEGAPGHYLATLLFPAPGEWRWEIQPHGAGVEDYPASVLSPLQVRAAPAATLGDAALGAALFLDKGCVSCHENSRVEGNTLSGVGPDLTHYSNDAAFLRRWLADPNAVRPGTPMPTLPLSGAEIEALVAFLGAP